MNKLDIINAMLGSMGEAPLNTLTEPHAFRGSALGVFDTINEQVQARGWWFNMEEIELQPSSLDSSIYLPGDTAAVRTATRNVVRRGNRLYNLDGGVFVFTENVAVQLIRLVDIEDLPEAAAQHIRALCVLRFQTTYDGDSAKTRQLHDEVFGADGTRVVLWSEHTRNRRSNFITSNSRLQRLKLLTLRARAGLR